MRVCVITDKPCWQDEDGLWYSSGGFPMQMDAIGSIFDTMTLIIGSVSPRGGAIRLPSQAKIVPVSIPDGKGFTRKAWFARNFIRHVRILVKEIRESDAIHLPLPGDLPLLGYAVALLLRKRSIVRYAGSWTVNSQTTLWNRISRTLMRLTVGPRNVMLVAGAGELPPAPGMHWLYATAISRTEAESVPVDMARIPNGHLKLIYAGRLSPEKGLRDLIRAMGILKNEETLRQRLPSLLLVGDGPQRQELQTAVCNEGLEKIVTFAGQADRPTLYRYFLDSDLCVIPSLSEGFGKARIDAMLCGVPVLTTDAGPARAIIGADGERGWVCKTGDPDNLAGYLKQIIAQPPDWTSLKARCRDFAQSLTLEAWADHIGSLCANQWGMEYREGRLR
jgi:glycosyltransferase involved in cell wall biosynthesis